MIFLNDLNTIHIVCMFIYREYYCLIENQAHVCQSEQATVFLFLQILMTPTHYIVFEIDHPNGLLVIKQAFPCANRSVIK